MSVGRKLGKAQIALGGAFLGVALLQGIPQTDSNSIAIQDKRQYIESRQEELGSTETISRNGVTYAVIDNELIPLAEQRNGFRYNDEGMPTGERRGGRPVAAGINVLLGAVNIGLGLMNTSDKGREND